MLTRNQIIIIGAGVLTVIVVVLILVGFLPGLQTPADKPPAVSLTVWGADDLNSFNSFIESYKKIRPNVSINYSQIPEKRYEENLIGSLAAGGGPDILMFKNSWLRKHTDKITPAPSNQFSLAQLRQLFPQVVEQNFASDGKIYALPLYVDTLALLYNKDVFDAQAIALAPQSWEDFRALIPKLREVNQSGQIVKAAAAIGASEKSVSRASDLLNLLFMQFGNPVIDEQGGGVRFDDKGLSALNFYLQFANPQSLYYGWNENFGNSLDSFSQSKVAMIFAYNSQIPVLKNKNPFLNLEIAPVPQFENTNQPVSTADYSGLAVSRQSKKVVWAWDFIIQTTANSSASDTYLQVSKRPPALRSLIEKYKDDPELGVFARQVLIARSWRQSDPGLVSQSFSNAIASILTGQLSPKQALDRIQNEINSFR